MGVYTYTYIYIHPNRLKTKGGWMVSRLATLEASSWSPTSHINQIRVAHPTDEHHLTLAITLAGCFGVVEIKLLLFPHWGSCVKLRCPH